MGGVFSSGVDNNDLVNILKLLGYIRTKRVEWVFRAVDRGDYVLPSHRVLAYKDLSWKLGCIHLSAPCVYCKVMEGLSLKPGLSFLNIGSGTGYLSTMAGLILGKNGTNHGIEIHEECIVYAYEHLESFKQNSLDVDTFEFCEPVFQLGNILNVTPNRLYDRVYCGAACPESHEKYIKQFVKIGGILVMPYKDNLLRIQRLGENSWRYHTMLPVSFASLVTPPEGKDSGLLQLPMSQPYSLQELCRSSIRCHLRKLVWSEHIDLECKMPIKAPSVNQRTPTHRGRDNPFLETDRSPVRNGESPTRFNIDFQGLARRFFDNVDDDEDEDEEGGRRGMTTSDDSEDGDEAGTENPARETSKFEAEMQEDFFEAANHAPMEDDDCGEKNTREPKKALDAGTEDRENERGNRRGAARPSDSKLKRKSDAIGPNNEPHNSRQRYRLDDQSEFRGESSGDQAAPTASSSNGLANGATSDPRPDAAADADAVADDDDDDEDRDADWLEQAFSILKDKYGMEVTSDSTSDTSDSSREDAAAATNDTSSSSSEDAAVATIDDAAEAANAVLMNSDENSSLFVSLLAMTMQNIAASNAADSRANGAQSERIAAREGKNSRPTESSEAPEDEDERPRTPEKWLPAGVSNSTSSSDSSSDEDVADEAAKSRRDVRNGRKRRSDQRSDASGRNNDDDDDDSSTETSAYDCSDSDSDIDFFLQEGNLKRNTYARTICTERVTRFMRSKVEQLPLPMPLRLYLNYNREL